MDLHNDTHLEVLGEEPFNAEPSLTALVEHPITPKELLYARNHCPIKDLSADTFTLKVDGLVENKLELKLTSLLRDFDKVEIVAAMECAGNRRKAMQEKKNKEVEGLLWGEGTICNVRWGGVRLRDVLSRAKISTPQILKNSPYAGLYACFASHITPCQEDDWFGASVPLQKAMDEEGDVLIAYEMNGSPLTPDHGYPMRIVVPGHVGTRWVKWVDTITVSNRESDNYYQQKDYKVLPKEVDTHDKADSESWWSKVPALQVISVNSAIGRADVMQDPPRLCVKGYAVAGPSGPIKQIYISIDDKHTWLPADITYQEGQWSWTLWEVEVPLSEKLQHGKIYCRATDVSGETQPDNMDWNLRGVAYSAVGERGF